MQFVPSSVMYVCMCVYEYMCAASIHPFMYVGEADLVLHYVKCLIEAKINPKDIAVIAPYNLQVMHGHCVCVCVCVCVCPHPRGYSRD